MKTRQFLLYSLAVLLFAFTSCKESPEDAGIDRRLDHFPIEEGHWVEYQIDSTVYDLFSGTVYTNTYQVREFFESTFLDNDERPSVRIERSYRDNDTMEWVLRDIWYATRTEQEAERQEENVRFIKMVFPPLEGNQWNGNVYIDFDAPGTDLDKYQGWEYAYSNLSGTYDNGLGSTFSNVTEIQHIDDGTEIDYRFSKEIYAADVGLVYKEYWDLKTQTIQPGVPWEDKAEEGWIIRQKVIDYKQ